MTYLTAAQELEKAREVTSCPQGVELQEHLKQLVAENLTMIRLLTDISENHVEYFSEGEDGMFAGVPLDYVSEINMYVSRDVNEENPFPATASILREAEARGVDDLAELYFTLASHEVNQSIADSWRESARLAKNHATQLREGKA